MVEKFIGDAVVGPWSSISLEPPEFVCRQLRLQGGPDEQTFLGATSNRQIWRSP
jgi:hypothetical protein